MLWTTSFQKPKKLFCDSETLTERYGCFQAQPFERGFGTTIGNLLRRALLSSIPGTAITAVRIDRGLSESARLQGVKEDVGSIILNMKRIPFKLKGSDAKTLRFTMSGRGEFLSSQIPLDEDVEIFDPNVKIATLEGAVVEVELRLRRGYGYVPATRNYEEHLGAGFIPLDAAFSPVRKVDYQVEAARLGQDTDYDKLLVQIWTDGSITPEAALNSAAQLLKAQMTKFINFEEWTEVQEIEQEAPLPQFNEHLDRSVEELELSVRSYNCLKNADIRTIRELVQKTEAEMLKTKNFGRKSLNEIKEILGALGLRLGMRFDGNGNIIED
ncbi:MAG: DNA-directed RNA polymerase subunit alpha [Blastocatellia bacterium]|nr:DNA-directed RNA polymerase subunit alpha [Blastocatellia bacterium]